ncbi:hypothetical protein Tco_0996710, partial [Tanacetum coccineum]
MFIILITLLMYGVSYDAEERYSQINDVYVNIARHGRLVFGSFLLVCLASVIVPSFLQPFVFAIYVMCCAYGMIYWLHEEIADEVDGLDI